MYWPLHQQFMHGSTDVRLYFLVNKVKYALDGEIKLKILDILQILYLQPQIPFAFMELVAQALSNIQDLEALDRLQAEALRSENEDAVRQWLGEYLPPKEAEIKRQSDLECGRNTVLKVLRLRRFPPDLLGFAARVLNSIQDLKILDHLQDKALLDSENENDVYIWLNDYLPSGRAADAIDGDLMSRIESKVDSILKILRTRFELPYAFLQFTAQALRDIAHLEKLEYIEDAALDSRNEEAVFEWLNELLPEGDAAGQIKGTLRSKTDSILKILRRLEVSSALLELAAQTLGHIYDIVVLDHLEDAALASKDEHDVCKWLDEYLLQSKIK